MEFKAMDDPELHEPQWDSEDKASHVSLGQISHASQHSDEEVLPVITSRTSKVVAKPPVLRYTSNKEPKTRHTSTLLCDGDIDTTYQSASSPGGFIHQSELRSVILPRLAANSEQKCSSPSRSSDGEQIKFPHINRITHANAHLALNRSITDLLDPEMDILNKIKHLPKRKRRRRKQKLTNPNNVLTLKCDNDTPDKTQYENSLH